MNEKLKICKFCYYAIVISNNVKFKNEFDKSNKSICFVIKKFVEKRSFFTFFHVKILNMNAIN